MKGTALIDQTKLHDPKNGVNDNCLAACVATVLGLHLSQVPTLEDDLDRQFDTYTEFLASIGRRAVYHPAAHPPKGLSIGTVRSPRFENENHAVVCYDGKIFHDPHPTRASMGTEVGYYETLELYPMIDGGKLRDMVRQCRAGLVALIGHDNKELLEALELEIRRDSAPQADKAAAIDAIHAIIATEGV